MVYRKCEFHIVYHKLAQWDASADSHVVVMDLWRILATHPQSADLHKGSDDGWHLIAHVLNVIKKLPDSNAAMLGTRCVCEYACACV